MDNQTHRQQVSDILKQYPEDFSECRDTGHRWSADSATWLQGGGILRILSCDRCKSKRNQTLDRNGNIVAGAYAYEKGYAMVGIGRLDTQDRALVRKMNAHRMLG